MKKYVFFDSTKRVLGKVIFLLCALFVCQVQASMAPFGLEVGKTTMDDLKKKVTFTEIAKNPYYGWNHWVKDPQQLKDVKAVEALFVVDEDGILQAIALWKDKTLFDQELGSFSKEYQAVKRQTPAVGDKYVEFRDSHSNIVILEVTYKIDSQLFELHQTPLFHKKYKEKENQTKS